MPSGCPTRSAGHCSAEAGGRVSRNQGHRRGVHWGVGDARQPAYGDEEAGLVDRLAGDLDAAFAQLLAVHGAAVYTTALRVSRQPADAEDMAAETFARAYAALRGYPPERTRALRLRPWLITITLNLWRNQVRAASRRPTVVALAHAGERPDPASGPEQEALDVDGRAQLADLLVDLPEPQRVAVVLRHVVGMSHGEISTVLGCPEGTVKSHVFRALTALRTRLASAAKEGRHSEEVHR